MSWSHPPSGDTGLDVRAGDVIDYQAAGMIGLSNDNNDRANPAGAWNGRRAENAPIKDKPAGALIGRIGNGAPVFLGDRGQVKATNSGRVFLSVNDDYLQDNSAEYRVTMQVRR
jgi:hypothetical protein